MSKLNISMEGSRNELINDLALVLLQHDKMKDVVLGAASRVKEIEELKAKLQAENVAIQMKEMINQNNSPHDTDQTR